MKDDVVTTNDFYIQGSILLLVLVLLFGKLAHVKQNFLQKGVDNKFLGLKGIYLAIGIDIWLLRKFFSGLKYRNNMSSP